MRSKAKLLEIADIRQGYQFRKKVMNDPNGKIKVIQMADIDEQYNINWKSLSQVNEYNQMKKHFIKKNEILFCSRGTNNYSVLIENQTANTIAVSQFNIISVAKNEIAAGYLAWYLQQKPAITYFKTHTLISTVPLINKNTLENLTVPVPSLEKQKRIAELFKLSKKEHVLTLELADKKEKLLHKTLALSLDN